MDEKAFIRRMDERVIKKFVQIPAEKTYVDAKKNLSNTMVNVQTGNLRNNLEYSYRKTGDIVKITITSDTPYSSFVHEGTRPHIIRPVRKQVLKFQVGGRTVFTKEVNHPGTKARPFLRKALKKYFKSVR